MLPLPRPRTVGDSTARHGSDPATADLLQPREDPTVTVRGVAAGLLGLQLLATMPAVAVSVLLSSAHVVGGLVMAAAAAAALSKPLRRHLGGLEVLLTTLLSLVTAAAVVIGTLLSRTTGLPGGYHPDTWGWSPDVALMLALSVLVLHLVALVLAQRDAGRLDR